MISSHTD